MKTRQFPATSLGACVAIYVLMQLLSSGKCQPTNPDEMWFHFPSPGQGTVFADTNVTIGWSGCCESGCPDVAVGNPSAANVLLFQRSDFGTFGQLGQSFTINCTRAAGGRGCYTGPVLNGRQLGSNGIFQLMMEMSPDFKASGTFQFAVDTSPGGK